jgi:hypothetical protein
MNAVRLRALHKQLFNESILETVGSSKRTRKEHGREPFKVVPNFAS